MDLQPAAEELVERLEDDEGRPGSWEVTLQVEVARIIGPACVVLFVPRRDLLEQVVEVLPWAARSLCLRIEAEAPIGLHVPVGLDPQG